MLHENLRAEAGSREHVLPIPQEWGSARVTTASTRGSKSGRPARARRADPVN